MILSCSRRTDIPAFYSDWFINRIKSGTVCVVNPFNPNQISRIQITPDVVDCIVFWTKNPKPLMRHLDFIDSLGYNYYFQFTITPYSVDIEPGIQNKSEIIDTFIELSNKIGKEKVILRYDPILLTTKYDLTFHERAFEKLCRKLASYTEKVVISYVDEYRKNKRNMETANMKKLNNEQMVKIAQIFKRITERYGLVLETCAEEINLNALGISHGRCIDGDLIESLVGYKIINKDQRDDNRDFCGCMKCIDIGQYDTCNHGCAYCYANASKHITMDNVIRHNPRSEILIGEVDESKVSIRKDVKSFMVTVEQEQLTFLDE
jgi:hypothetical protein